MEVRKIAQFQVLLNGNRPKPTKEKSQKVVLVLGLPKALYFKVFETSILKFQQIMKIVLMLQNDALQNDELYSNHYTIMHYEYLIISP